MGRESRYRCGNSCCEDSIHVVIVTLIHPIFNVKVEPVGRNATETLECRGQLCIEGMSKQQWRETNTYFSVITTTPIFNLPATTIMG